MSLKLKAIQVAFSGFQLQADNVSVGKLLAHVFLETIYNEKRKKKIKRVRKSHLRGSIYRMQS